MGTSLQNALFYTSIRLTARNTSVLDGRICRISPQTSHASLPSVEQRLSVGTELTHVFQRYIKRFATSAREPGVPFFPSVGPSRSAKPE